MGFEKAMSQTLRARILDFVRQYPATHVRELERQLGLTDRLGAYHLKRLETEGLVRAVREAGFLAYWPAEEVPAVSRSELRRVQMLRRVPATKIALLLLEHGAAFQGQIAEALCLSKATTSYHLSRLLKAGYVTVRTDGRLRLYELKDPAAARRALQELPPVPGSLDEFSELWDDLVG